MVGSEEMRALVAESLLKTLGDEQRDKLITGAIKSLLEPSKGNYGTSSGPSELERVFQSAVQTLAHTMVQDKLSNDEAFKSKMSAVISEACEKFLAEKRESTVDRMATALADGFKMQY